MAGCWMVQGDLTAWIDGELSARRAERVGRHLASCGACASEAESLRDAIAHQRSLLERLAAVDVSPALSRRVLREIAEESEEPRSWLWLFRPVAVAAATAAVAMLGLFTVVGGPRAVLIPLGVEPPPPAVTRTTDLYKDYPIIEKLDALENFDTVESIPLDEDQEPQRG